MNIEIRYYKDSDLDSVNEILEEAFQVEKENFKGEEFCEIVAVTEEMVVGYLLLTKVYNPIGKKNIYYVDYVCVDSEYRRHNIGKKLLEFAYQEAKIQGGDYLQLTCSRFRAAAHKLYDSCDFVMRDSDIYRKDII